MSSSFFKICDLLKEGEHIKYETLTFTELFELKYPSDVYNNLHSRKSLFDSFNIFAILLEDVEMTYWNGIHPVEKNTTSKICTKGTLVKINMVSRFGDIGITDNLSKEFGYSARGIQAEQLHNWKIQKKHATK